MTAKSRYDNLSSNRSQILTEAADATKLRLPQLIRGQEDYSKGMKLEDTLAIGCSVSI